MAIGANGIVASSRPRWRWRGQKTLNELSSEFGLHPMQLAQWKRQANEGLADVFAGLTPTVDNGVACSGLKPYSVKDIGSMWRPRRPIPAMLALLSCSVQQRSLASTPPCKANTCPFS